jgi:hypothetical protein
MQNINIELFSPECSLKTNFWQKYYFKLLFPPILCIFLLLLFVLRWVFALKFPSQAQKLGISEKMALSRKLIAVFSFMVVAFYTVMMSSAVQPFDCTRQSDGTFTLTKSPSSRCFDSVWFSHLPAIVFFILLYGFSIPAVMIYIFYSNRHQKSTIAFLSKYNSLVSPYQPRFFYFEIVAMFKRTLFVMANDFLSPTSYAVRYFVSLAILMGFVWVDVYFFPYRSKELNILSCS